MSANKVVVGYDGTPGAEHALSWALREADRRDARLELVYALFRPAYVPAAFMAPGTVVWADQMAMQAVQDILTAAVDKAHVDHPNVPITTVTERGAAVPALRDHAAGAALLVVGSRGHRPFAGLLLGSVAEAVTAHAPTSVVVVRHPVPLTDDRPVVLGLDDGDHRSATVGFAFEQAAALGVPLLAVHAWMPPSDPWIGSPTVDREEVAVAERTRAGDMLDDWRAKYPSVPVTVESVAGHPDQVLTEFAAGAQLVVVGARGGGGFHGLRLGSVTRHLLHHGSSTIAVIR